MTTINPAVTAASNPTGSVSGALDNTEIASNFTTFLQLLTTQLKNQDPLSPMDTNQFTQQLVEFAGVEQQMKTNDTLSTLVSLQQSAQTSQALSLVGANVVVNGNTAQLVNNKASWALNATQPATAKITITAPSGATVYTGTTAVSAGSQIYTWNGVGNDGNTWPAGNYTLTATAVTASGQATTVTTQVAGPVSSVDLTQTPPVLTIGGQNYTINDIQRILAPAN
ncbi:MAG TPA: flagellar hook capping FlgD N-terminal domain-containing protein [Pseudolabrys sp.]|nr:flagellar hook capping FlgD N-terminal domain-containing protein [Pseudolabrys sp.]